MATFALIYANLAASSANAGGYILLSVKSKAFSINVNVLTTLLSAILIIVPAPLSSV